MPKAIWRDTVIAESDAFETVEGNVYFPPAALKQEFFRPNERTTVCGWKGTASYYDVVVGGEVNPAAAWTYHTPKDAAAQIKDYVAFWNGVTVER